MRYVQSLIQVSALIAIITIAAPATAEPIQPAKPAPTVKVIAASLSNTLASILPRPITPADSGILLSMGRSDQADFTVPNAHTEVGRHEIASGKTDGDLGAVVGYRKALSQRWSLDTQFERQRVRRASANDTITTQDSSESVAHWASAAGVYHAPITPKISLHAGGGAFVWKRELKTSAGGSSMVDKETGTDLLVQMGLGYRIIPRAKIEANVQRFFMPDKPLDRISLGVVIQTD